MKKYDLFKGAKWTIRCTYPDVSSRIINKVIAEALSIREEFYDSTAPDDLGRHIWIDTGYTPTYHNR